MAVMCAIGFAFASKAKTNRRDPHPVVVAR